MSNFAYYYISWREVKIRHCLKKMKCWINHAIDSVLCRYMLHRAGPLLPAFPFFFRNYAIVCVRLIFQSILKGVSSEGLVWIPFWFD